MATDPLVNHLLSLRSAPAARAALRRALSPTTEHYAYPYLARWWQGRGWARRPTLVLGGLMGAFPGIEHRDKVPLGRLASSLSTNGTLEHSGIERKLVAAQHATLERLVPTLRLIFAAAERSAVAVDWDDVWRTVRYWDHPIPAVRNRTRRALLERFYQTPDTEPAQPKENTPSCAT
jgi:CRISPR type I-E-associated protein CasB/Cse2